MAGTTDVKSLLLEVDASVELLRRNLQRGDAAVAQFETDTRKRLEQTDRRFEQFGGGLRQFPGTIARARAEIATLGTSVGRVEQQVRASSASMKGALLGSASVIAAAFSVDRVRQYADGYTSFTNQLKVAGLAGQALAATQEQLYTIAQKYGVQLESVGTLYSRASQAATALGASQADLLRFTDGVGAALKVQGGSAEEAQGALLQLSQLLASGTVHAEEFNSVNEGARPILQAVANGIDKYKGSVAALRADVLAGKLTSQDFFQGFLKGSGQLEQQASRANLTIGASFTILNNALGKYIGEADAGLSATNRVSQAVITLSQHLDLIVPALALIGAGFATRFAAGPISAAVTAVAAVRAELFASNVVMLGGATAAAAKAQYVAASAQTEVASIEATIAARRAEQVTLRETIAAEAELAATKRAEAALAANSNLTSASGRTVAVRAQAKAENDATFATQRLAVARERLAIVDGELAVAEGSLAGAQARATVATEASTVATDAATLSARAGAAASRLLAGGLTLIGGSVAGGAAVLTIGALVSAVLLSNSAMETAEQRHRDTAQAMVETAEGGKKLNAIMAQTAALSAPAAGGIAAVGNASAGSTGQVRVFAGAVGALAQQLYNLAAARRAQAIADAKAQGQAATLRANTAQARIDARNSQGAFAAVGGAVGLSDLDDNARDARTVAANRAQAEAARRAAADAAAIPLDRRVSEADRPGGRDVATDRARIARDLAIARQSGNKVQVRSLQADQFEVNQYAQYRSKGLSVEESNRQAAADAARFRSATAEGVARADSAKSAREGAAAGRRQAAAARDAAGDAKAYTAAERQANDAIAAARADLSGSAEERAQIEKQRIESERQSRNEEIADAARQGRYGTGDTAKGRVAELTRLNNQRASLETQAVDAHEKQRLADEQLAISQATTDNQVELLQKQVEVTTSLSQRRALELRILDLQYQEERAKLEGVLASKTSTDAEKKIAEERLRILGQLQGADEKQVAQRNEGPLDQYRRRLHEATDDMRTALQRVQVDGLETLEDGLVSVVTGTETVAGAFKKMAAAIIADLARIAIERAILGAIGGGDGGSDGGGTGGSFLSQIFGGKRELGGPVTAGKAYLVGEKRPEIFVPGTSGTIIPRLPNLTGSARSSATSITYAPNYNVQGSGPELDALRSEMARDRAEFPARAAAAIIEAKKRNVIR